MKQTETPKTGDLVIFTQHCADARARALGQRGSGHRR